MGRRFAYTDCKHKVPGKQDAAQTGSPRQIVKLAYQAGLVTDESLWLAALNARKNVAHAYNQDIALQIVAQSKAQYFAMFTELKQKIEAEWL